MKTEAWSSAFLTTTNVAPQSNEQKASARSALARLGPSIEGNSSSGMAASLSAGITGHKLHSDALAAIPACATGIASVLEMSNGLRQRRRRVPSRLGRAFAILCAFDISFS